MQQQMLHRLVAGAVAGMCTAAATMPAGAAGPRREASQSQAPAQPVTQILNQKLVWTAVQGDSSRVALNAGFSNIGTPYTFNCAHACTVVVQTMVQVEENNPYWAICPTIDGVDAIQGCNWQGIASSNQAVYATGNGTYFWSLSPGKHTIQGQVYFSIDGALDNWGMTIAKYNAA